MYRNVKSDYLRKSAGFWVDVPLSHKPRCIEAPRFVGSTDLNWIWLAHFEPCRLNFELARCRDCNPGDWFHGKTNIRLDAMSSNSVIILPWLKCHWKNALATVTAHVTAVQVCNTPLRRRYHPSQYRERPGSTFQIFLLNLSNQSNRLHKACIHSILDPKVEQHDVSP